MDLKHCNISNVEAETFAHLPSLTYLDMSENVDLTFRNLRNILVSYGLTFTTIKVLRLNAIHTVLGSCTTVLKRDIEFLNKTNITHFYLDSNRIATIEVEAVDYIPRTLETISVKSNIFMIDEYVYYLFYNFPARNLKNLIISYQSQTHFFDQPYRWMKCLYSNSISFKNHRHKNNDSVIVNVHKLYNAVENRAEECKINTMYMKLPKHVSYIDASNSNYKGIFYHTKLVAPNNLTYLLLNNNIIWKIIGPFEGFDNLQFLDLSSNYCENISQYAFLETPKLLHLNLSTNFLGFALEIDENGKTFQALSALRNLDLTNNKIRKLPLKIFDGLINLQTLHLSHNMLNKLDVVFDHMKRLEYLSLRDNMLATIPKALRDNFDRLAISTNFTLDLEMNHFRCSCNASHQDFLLWMIQTQVRLSRATCTFDNGTEIAFSNRSQMSDIYQKLVKECSNYLLLLVVCVSLTLLAIVLTVTAVAYRFRWNIRYMYYMAKFKLKGYKPLPDDRHRYKYDVFVSYADEDRSFVKNEIVEKLENGYNLTLLIHDRDFIAGEFVGDNIVKAITNSRKTLIVLSKDFLKSQWCMYELNMARMEAISRGESVICIIKREDIPTGRMPLEVLNVMQNQTYIDYPQEDEFKQPFWERVVASLSEI